MFVHYFVIEDACRQWGTPRSDKEWDHFFRENRSKPESEFDKGNWHGAVPRTFMDTENVGKSAVNSICEMGGNVGQEVTLGAGSGFIVRRYHGPKSRYTNPGTHDKSSPRYVRGKTPLPSDAEAVYAHAIPDPSVTTPNRQTWYGRNPDGLFFRYQGTNGEVHFNAILERMVFRIASQSDCGC